MDHKLGITYEMDKEHEYVIKTAAIEYGITFDQMLERMVMESATVINHLDEVPASSEFETKEEFFKRFSEAMQSTFKRRKLKMNEIKTLQVAYYLYQMQESGMLPNESLHDKARLKKYQGARNTIEELLAMVNFVDAKKTLHDIDIAIQIVEATRISQIKFYKQEMNEEFDRLKLTVYARENIIETFQKSL